ncbi:hypothetical protein [uncultured Bacteroides sp.]|uniref:hypothetical protein n=1 Tax=uncultured Bacteroides sp. TaxID=162156 RepID=UPI0025DF1BFE|nr:hypothetical protein [uncultured Bacteroides sp.]
MSITSGINVPRHKHRYPANGMPAQGISGAFPRRLVCKDFAIVLGMWRRKIQIVRKWKSRAIFHQKSCRNHPA